MKALRTDRIDIYLLHRDNETAEVGPLVDVVNQMHTAGTIGAFGLPTGATNASRRPTTTPPPTG